MEERIKDLACVLHAYFCWEIPEDCNWEYERHYPNPWEGKEHKHFYERAEKFYKEYGELSFKISIDMKNLGLHF